METSVYSYEQPDGTTYWQRPIAGHGLLPGDPALKATTAAYDANGNIIGTWTR